MIRAPIAPPSGLLEVDALSVEFPVEGRPRQVVSEVSFAVRSGEVVGLVGTSGSGKSMIAMALLRLVPPPGRIASGRVRLAGQDLSALTGEALRRLRGGRIALVTQDPASALDPLFSVGDQVAEVARAHGLGRRAARALARLRLAQVGLAPSVAGSYPHQISGGQRQRAALAVALAGRPSLLLADEPTSSLDATLQAQVLDRIGALAGEGLGVLLITHDLAVVAAHCSRVLVLSNGRLVESGSTTEVLDTPRHEETRRLLDAAPRLGRGAGAESAARSRRTVLLETRGLRRTFPLRAGLFGRRVGEIRAVQGVDLAIEQGSAVGLVGESGSGKTTIGRCLVGLDRPTEGSVLRYGVDLSTLARPARARARLGLPMIFQDSWGALDPRATVEASIAEALRARGVGRQARAPLLASLLAEVGLGSAYARRYPHELSGGQRQRVALARALACGPELVVADEPTSALDTVSREQVLALLSHLHRERGLAILLISHDLAAVEQVTERIVVLFAGRVVESGPTAELIARPLHPYTRALIAAVAGLGRLGERRPGVGRTSTSEVPPVEESVDPGGGCRYRLRCPVATSRCGEEEPELRRMESGAQVACFYPGSAVATPAGLVAGGGLS